MRRVILGLCVSGIALLLVFANCAGRGGIVSTLTGYMTPYATPAAKTPPLSPTSTTTSAATTASNTPAPKPTRTRGPYTPPATRGSNAFENDLIDTDPTRNVELAQTALRQEGFRFTLIIVSPTSIGLAGEIYRDLLKRNFRATTGPDEGFDTSAYPCHPFCVFVRQETVNEISVPSWQGVLRHEYRHMVQAANNPNLAREYRPLENGLFSTYAAFLEACADNGIFVADTTYHSSERMPQLRLALGDENESLRQRACVGHKEAYNSLVKSYELKQGEGSFAVLFPPYK